MSITFVSAYLILNESRPEDKKIDKCLQYFSYLYDIHIPIHLFLSKTMADYYHDFFPSNPNINIELIELTDLDTYKSINDLSLNLPDIRHSTHDSRLFLTLMNAKVELVNKAIQSGLYSSSHYAWIDFNISHVFKDPIQTCNLIKQYSLSEPISPLLIIPGCWNKGIYSDSFFSKVNWRFCGGFFLGDIDSIINWYNVYKTHFYSILEHHKAITWEVNIWHLFELNGWIQPSWCLADHNDSLVKLPSTTFKSISQPKYELIPYPREITVFWDGAYSACHKNKSIYKFINHCLHKFNVDASIVIPHTDGIISNDDYYKMINTPNVKGVNNISEYYSSALLNFGIKSDTTFIGCLCSRNVNNSRFIYLTGDDDIFEYGLSNILLKQNIIIPSWNDKKNDVFWRGGTSGFDRPSLRTQVVSKLFDISNTNVKLTKGGWPENEIGIPDSYFSDKASIQEHLYYKYLCIIDGACIASNFMWVFGSGSVPIIISHPHNEFWFKSHLKDGINCIIIEYDLSNLISKINWLISHDDESQIIAQNAYNLSLTLFTPNFQRKFIEHQINEKIKLTDK